MNPTEETMLLRRVLLVVSGLPGIHHIASSYHDMLLHSPVYEVPFDVHDLAAAAGQHPSKFIPKMREWMEENFQMPEGGAAMVRLPAGLCTVMEEDTRERGVHVKRHFAFIQPQNLAGQVWLDPFDHKRVDEMLFAIVCSAITGPRFGVTTDKWHCNVPLVMRFDGAEYEVSTSLDPDDEIDVSHKQKVRKAIKATLHTATGLLYVLSHLQKGGTLEEYRRTVPPPMDGH